MNVQVLDQDKKANKLSLLFKGVPVFYANALRRLITDEVPTMAVDEVEIKKNNSILYDEMVAHRLGLVPLKTDLKSYVTPEEAEAKGKGPASYQCKLVMKAAKQGFVLAEDLKSKDPAIAPAEPKIPIAKLMKGQTIELEATAVLGRGREHAKFSPGHVYYRHKPDIKIGNVKNAGEVVEGTQEGVFEIKGGQLAVVKDNIFKYDLAGAAEEISGGAVKEENSEDIIFNIESWGQLSCKEMITQALTEFDAMLDECAAALKAAK